MRTVRKHSRYVPEATRKVGMRDLTPPTRLPDGRYFFGVKVSASVAQVVVRRSVPHAAAFAVYISAYP